MSLLRDVRPVFALLYVPQFLCLTLGRMLNGMGVELDDSALMLRYKDGDVAAFEVLYARHRESLYRYLLRQMSNQQFAEDVFQEVWSRIIRNRGNYRPSAKFTTYMYHIARNCSIDHFRRRDNQQALVTEQGDAIDTAVAPTGDPVVAAQMDDSRAALTTALNELSDEQREAFLLREEGGLTLEEIGTVTGVGRETVKSRLRYALARLRTLVTEPERQGNDDG